MFVIMLYLYPYNHHHDGFGHICWGTEFKTMPGVSSLMENLALKDYKYPPINLIAPQKTKRNKIEMLLI